MPSRDGTFERARYAPAERLPRVWTLLKAARPSHLLLVCLVYALGAGIAAGMGAASSSPARDSEFAIELLGGLATLLPFATTVHYANEYADHETDALTDRTPFSGGSGALHRTGLDRRLLAVATFAASVFGVVSAIVMNAIVDLPVDALFVLFGSFVLGLAYSLPPVALVRRGVGEVVNALLGGFLLPMYAVAVVGEPTVAVGLAVVPFTLVVGCNLLATHWPDREADAAVGKRTLAVRWSPVRLRTAYYALAIGAVGLVVALSEFALPRPVALAHLPALPFLVWGGVVLTRQRSPFPSVMAMVVLGVSTAMAWWWVALT